MSPIPLTSPRTGIFLEVSFRRLLEECEAVVRGSDRLSPEVLQAYTSAVATLRVSLQEPAVPATFHAPDAPPKEASPAREAAPSASPSPRAALGLRHRGDPGPDARGDRGLGSHAQLQDALTDELAVLAASLKTNTLAMEGRVRERGALLDATEVALDRSLAGVKASNLSAAAIHRKRRLGFCLTLLALIGIVSAFVGMYLFIKLTSLAGYRAARVVHVMPDRGLGRWSSPHSEL